MNQKLLRDDKRLTWPDNLVLLGVWGGVMSSFHRRDGVLRGVICGLIFAGLLILIMATTGLIGKSITGRDVVVVAFIIIFSASLGGTIGWIWEFKEKIRRLEGLVTFVKRFVTPPDIQPLIDKQLEAQAVEVDRIVKISISFQNGGLSARGKETGDMTEDVRQACFDNTKYEIEGNLTRAKKEFWHLYDFVETWSKEMFNQSLTKKPRSYKSYLPTEPESVPSQKGD